MALNVFILVEYWSLNESIFVMFVLLLNISSKLLLNYNNFVFLSLNLAKLMDFSWKVKEFGIVGLGSIGTEVGKRLEAFGCIISYVPYPFHPNVSQLATISDVLIICCSLADQTRHMINREVMTALGKGGVIVNVRRGAIVDEKEWVKCLVEGEIGGADLDVFENEPNVPKELFGLDNVVLLPHRAAFSEESFFDCSQLVIANLEAFFENKPLLSPVIDC